MFKTKIQFHTHLSSWICPGHFQGLVLEMTAEGISNSSCLHYLQWMAFHLASIESSVWETPLFFHSSRPGKLATHLSGEGKGQVQHLSVTVTQGQTDRLCPTPGAFSRFLNNYTNTPVWEKISNIICSKIIWQESSVSLYRKWLRLLQSNCDAPDLPNEKYDA